MHGQALTWLADYNVCNNVTLAKFFLYNIYALLHMMCDICQFTFSYSISPCYLLLQYQNTHLA